MIETLAEVATRVFRCWGVDADFIYGEGVWSECEPFPEASRIYFSDMVQTPQSRQIMRASPFAH